MKINGLFSVKMLGLTAATLFISSNAYSITNPSCDSNLQDCGHTNVAFVSGFDANGLTVTLTRCSASLIHKDAVKVVYLTAAHCVKEWIDKLKAGEMSTIGVSMDPIIVNDSVLPTKFYSTQFVIDAIPVMYPNAGQGSSSKIGSNPYNVEDYGLVILTPQQIAAKNPTDAPWVSNFGNIVPQKLAQDASISIDNLVASVSDPKDIIFSAAGYGVLEIVKSPSNPKGGDTPNPATLGELRVSSHQSFRNLHELTIFTSQNPSHGDSGTCGGDSGGPNYYTPLSGEFSGQEIQVGITSAGDASCRATSTVTRLDIDVAKAFIDCARKKNTIAEVQSCIAALPLL